MADTGRRTLRLLSLMQSRRYWAGADLAERLGVSVRTLRRDVERLRELGYPVEARPGVDGGYQLAPGAVLPPLVLDDDEAVALTVGLQHAAQSAIAGMAESSVRALTKVVPVLPARLRRRVDALQAVTVPAPWAEAGPVVQPDVLTTLAQACRDTERLRFGYTAAGGERSERLVEPFRLVPLGRRWYLVAYDLDRGDWRSFRLDRLADPVPTGARFAPRRLPADDAAAFVRAGIERWSSDFTVVAVVAAPADEVRGRIGRWSVVEPVDEATCRVRMQGDELAWPAFALGLVGAPCTVESPPELCDLLRDWGARFTAAAADRPRTAGRRPVPPGGAAPGAT